MSILMFLPWCQLDKTYYLKSVELIPVRVEDINEELVPIKHIEIVKNFLEQYKNINAKPIDSVTLIKHQKHSITDDLDDSEISEVAFDIDLACFCALADRKYFENGGYSNSECFALSIQNFGDAGSGFSSLFIKRRTGSSLSCRKSENISYCCPPNVLNINNIHIDELLLESLYKFKENDKEWKRCYDAIITFNLANTDNSFYRNYVECVLICGAFHHILDVEKPYYIDAPKKFSEIFKPYKEISRCISKRLSSKQGKKDVSLRYAWMEEFYSLRNDFAHSNLNSPKPRVWSDTEHLFLASIALPLTVKSILSKKELYELSDRDLKEIEIFERLADESFFETPDNQSDSYDSEWSRLMASARFEIATIKTLKRLEGKE